MFKKFLIGSLTAIILVGVGVSSYTALAAPRQIETQAAPAVAPAQVSDAAAVGSTTPGVESNHLEGMTWGGSTSLSAEDQVGLLFMYEEEKLARDVYQALYLLWGQPVFENIAASEQAHMDAVKTLLDDYGIAVTENAAGIFSNASLQALYNKLMARGNLSITEALKVGATIEEVDILDLQEQLALTTNAEIHQVYNNLLNGSYNHLRSFVSMLERQTGEIYQPQYLSIDLYQAILASTNGNMASTSGQGRGSHGDH